MRRHPAATGPNGSLWKAVVWWTKSSARSDEGQHLLRESPEAASRVETILGRPARVLPKTDGSATYFSYRIGKMKLLRPGGVYVLAVDYPEDVPRSMIVINTGNETSRGFHTGATVGDALHAKYVDSLCESIDVPLSGKWETWSLLFRLARPIPRTGPAAWSCPASPDTGRWV